MTRTDWLIILVGWSQLAIGFWCGLNWKRGSRHGRNR